MKSNKQGKIKVNKSGYKRSKFNWSHDVNTTFSWGEIQPTQCKMLIPGSKTTMQAQSLIRLAPMVAPTFGRVKYKTYNQFVAMADVFPNFDAMMAQEPKTTSFGTKVPKKIPTIKLGLLSSWVLQGARATIYFAEGADATARKANADNGLYKCYYRNSVDGDWPAVAKAYFNGFNATISGDQAFESFTDPWNNSANSVLPDVGRSVGFFLNVCGANYANAVGARNFGVILGNKYLTDLCPVARDVVEVSSDERIVPARYQKEVTFESADYVLECNRNGYYIAVALELSDYGKRVRKVLQGCGYQINFTSTTRVSILPLLAQYKAYFDIFGLQLYQGWETTNCARMIKYIENEFIEEVDSMFQRINKGNIASMTNANVGIAFMLNDIGNMWYTDDADYVSAHVNKLGVSPVLSDFSSFIDTNNGVYTTLGNNITDYATHNADGTNSSMIETNTVEANHSVQTEIYKMNHTELDSEMLKRLYRWTNRNTILGRRIAEILRAQGLGKYVDECKSYYIGSTDTMITISDVVSQAATDDAVLGEYGGKGLQYSNEKVLSFENDVYGYWITLATVVPEAGYTQGLDPTLTADDKFELYNPDFDAMGYEATPRENVVGNTSIANGEATVGDNNTFGFVPRYTKFKVCNNIVNGDFNRHGLRNVYMPYTLDKQLNINDYDVESEWYDKTGDIYHNTVRLNKSIKVANMPVAGNVWRYPTKYNWLGNFDRIFAKVGDYDEDKYSYAIIDGNLVGWDTYNNDNFLGHSIYDVNSYAPMKPIEESYGLEEDDSMRAGAEFTSKA